ncbi:hypothetical protein [Paenibacillus pini]
MQSTQVKGDIEMNLNYITLPSFWGSEVRHRHISNGSTSLVVFFPGQNYSCDLPLLYYAKQSALEHQNDVLLLEYGYQSARTELDFHYLDTIVEECLLGIRQISESYQTVHFVSKSLGTIIAGRVEESWKAEGITIRQLFLTPVDKSVPYLLQSSGMAIYGTNDPMISEESIDIMHGAAKLKVHAVPEGTHALEVSSVHHSLKILAELVELYDEFFNK